MSILTFNQTSFSSQDISNLLYNIDFFKYTAETYFHKAIFYQWNMCIPIFNDMVLFYKDIKGYIKCLLFPYSMSTLSDIQGQLNSINR